MIIGPLLKFHGTRDILAVQGVRVNPTLSMGSRCCRSRFGIDQLARHHGFGAIPQLRGQLRSRFVEHQLDQR
jgi:hypothetical protein